MTKDEALKLALEALEEPKEHIAKHRRLEAITAIQEVLAQPEQEPVACPYCKNWATLGSAYYDQNCVGCVKRMTAPPQRTWVGLTDEDDLDWEAGDSLKDLVKAIEAKLKEKNT